MRRDFLGGPCPCQCKGHGFDPWSQKIPCSAEQLSLCSTTTEPAHLKPGSATREVSTLRSPHTTTVQPPSPTTIPHCNQRKPACSNEDPVNNVKKDPVNKKTGEEGMRHEITFY